MLVIFRARTPPVNGATIENERSVGDSLPDGHVPSVVKLSGDNMMMSTTCVVFSCVGQIGSEVWRSAWPCCPKGSSVRGFVTISIKLFMIGPSDFSCLLIGDKETNWYLLLHLLLGPTLLESSI